MDAQASPTGLGAPVTDPLLAKSLDGAAQPVAAPQQGSASQPAGSTAPTANPTLGSPVTDPALIKSLEGAAQPVAAPDQAPQYPHTLGGFGSALWDTAKQIGSGVAGAVEGTYNEAAHGGKLATGAAPSPYSGSTATTDTTDAVNTALNLALMFSPAAPEVGIGKALPGELAVGGKLNRAATDASAATDALSQPTTLVPGSIPTTAQATGDMGLAGLEATARAANPAPFVARDAQQAQAQSAAVSALSPTGNPGAVRDFLQQRLDQIDADGNAAVQQAQQRAQQAYAAVGGQQPAQDLGAAMRDQLEAAKATTKANERQLWQAVDPDGSLQINAAPVQQTAAQIAGSIPRTAAPMAGEEAGIFNAASTLGPQTPFSDLAALRSRALDAIRTEAATNGQSQAWRRMQLLRGSIDDTMTNAAQGVAQQQASAVASGALDPNLTIAARLQDQANAFLANRRASSIGTGGPNLGPGLSGNAGMVPPAVPGAFGATGEAPIGPVRAQGLPGVAGPAQPPVTPTPFDAVAAARYRAAADATRARAQTYNVGQVGNVLQTSGGATGVYRVPDSAVPQRFISSPEGAQSFLQAGGDPGTLQGAFVSDLRRSATNPDGTLNPAKYQTWLKQRGPAMGSFPQLRSALGDAATAQTAVDTVAAQAKQARDAFQKGAAGRFLRYEDPATAVGKALGGSSPVSDMKYLANAVASDPDAKAGLQRAVAEHVSQQLIRNPDAAGVGTMSAGKVNDFLRSNQAIGQVLSPDQMKSLNAIAADLRRNEAVAGAKPIKTKGQQVGSILKKIIAPVAGFAAGYHEGGVVSGLIGASAGSHQIDKLIDLVTSMRPGAARREALLTEALLNPDLAKSLMTQATQGNARLIGPRLQAQLRSILMAPSAQQAPAQQR